MESLEHSFREAVALQRRGDLAAAIGEYRRIVAAAPDLVIARDNLCLALLAAGEYREGFGLYDVRFERQPGLRVERPALSFPEWRGEPLAGRSLLVWMEQGFGDQIMYARFVRPLVEAGAEVTVLAPPPLSRLFERLPAKVVRAEGAVSFGRHDYWVMPGSLPGRLGATLETLPAAPYLAVEAPRAGGFGAAWIGRPTPDPNRSIPEPFGRELMGWPGFVSLHPEDTGAADFEDTARLIAGLDRVVTIDSAVAHLAGAMGKPTSILLPHHPDWRWMWDRHDTPWYPTARLYRQPAPGDWRSVLDAVREDLARTGRASGAG